mgnify:CR=1 FL=1
MRQRVQVAASFWQNRTKVGLKLAAARARALSSRAAKSNQGGIETERFVQDGFVTVSAKSNQGGIETDALVAQGEAALEAKSNQGGIKTS